MGHKESPLGAKKTIYSGAFTRFLEGETIFSWVLVFWPELLFFEPVSYLPFTFPPQKYFKYIIAESVINASCQASFICFR